MRRTSQTIVFGDEYQAGVLFILGHPIDIHSEGFVLKRSAYFFLRRIAVPVGDSGIFGYRPWFSVLKLLFLCRILNISSTLLYTISLPPNLS